MKKTQNNKKDLIQFKDFIPDFANKKVREQQPIKPPDPALKDYKPQEKPSDLFTEWDSCIETLKDQSKVFSFNEISQFEDPLNSKIVIPSSLTKNSDITWLRPSEYIKEYLLEEEIKRLAPGKNQYKYKEKIKMHYENYIQEQKKLDEEILKKQQEEANKFKEENKKLNFNDMHRKNQTTISSNGDKNRTSNKEIISNDNIDKDTQINKLDLQLKTEVVDEEFENDKKFAKKFFKILKPNTYPLYIVNKIKSEDILNSKENTSNEPIDKLIIDKINSVVNKRAESTKNNKKVGNKLLRSETKFRQTEEKTDKNEKTEGLVFAYPNEMYKASFSSNFTKWMTGVFEIINKNQITDPEDPDGIPVYNPEGKYWIALYHFGVLRKIEIDDRIPCNKNKTFIFPKCNNGLYELWPALVTKALLKLYSYKYNSIHYIDLEDYSIIYSLTGYIPEKVINKNILNLNLYNDSLMDSASNIFNKTNKIEENKEEGDSKNNSINKSLYETKKIVKTKSIKSSSNLPLATRNLLDNFNNMEKRKEAKEAYSLLSDEEKLEFYYICRNILQDNKYLSKQKIIICSHCNPKFDEEMLITRKNKSESSYPRLNTRLSGINATRLSTKNLTSLQIKKESNKRLPALGDAFKKRMSIVTKEPPVIIKDSSNKRYDTKDSLTENRSRKNDSNINNQDSQYIPNITKIKALDKLLVNYPYTLIDNFDNEPTADYDFNLNRLTPIDFNKFKKQNADQNLKQVQYKQMTREEKKQYLEHVERINNDFKAFKRDRMENLDKPGNQYYLVKLMTEFYKPTDLISEDISNENSYCTLAEFSKFDIEMAKLCKLNKWRYSPLEYLESKFYNSQYLGVKLGLDKNVLDAIDMEVVSDNDNDKNKEKHDENKYFKSNASFSRERRLARIKKRKETSSNREDNEPLLRLSPKKSIISHNEVSSKKQNNTESIKTRWELYKKPKWTDYWFNLVPDITIFHKKIDLNKRKEGGWLQITELFDMFNKFVILHNPDFYRSNLVLNNVYFFYNDAPFEINTEMSSILLIGSKSEFLISKIINLEANITDKIIYQAQNSHKLNIFNSKGISIGNNNLNTNNNNAKVVKDKDKEKNKDPIKLLASRQANKNKKTDINVNLNEELISEILNELNKMKNELSTSLVYKDSLRHLINLIQMQTTLEEENKNEKEKDNKKANETNSPTLHSNKVSFKGKVKGKNEVNLIESLTDNKDNKEKDKDINLQLENIKWSNCKFDIVKELNEHHNLKITTNIDLPENKEFEMYKNRSSLKLLTQISPFNQSSKNRLIEIKSIEQLSQVGNIKNSNPNNSNNFNSNNVNFEQIFNNSSSVLIHFEPNFRENFDNCPLIYYIVFDLVTAAKKTVKKDIILSSINSSYQHDLLNHSTDYILIIKGGVFPYGFNVKVFSDHILYATSLFTLYKDIFNFPYYTYPIEKIISEGKKFNLMLKLKLDIRELLNQSNLKEILMANYNENQNNSNHESNHISNFHDNNVNNSINSKNISLRTELKNLKICDENVSPIKKLSYNYKTKQAYNNRLNSIGSQQIIDFSSQLTEEMNPNNDYINYNNNDNNSYSYLDFPEIQFKFSTDYSDIYNQQYLSVYLFEEDNTVNYSLKEFDLIDFSNYNKVYFNNLISHKPFFKIKKSFFDSEIWNSCMNNELNNNELVDKLISSNCLLMKDIYIILGIEPLNNTETEAFNFNIFSNYSNLNFQKIEVLDSFEVLDKYIPNKKGIIFQELVYAGEKISSTISISLKQTISNKENERIYSAVSNISDKSIKKKPPQSAKSEYNFTFGDKNFNTQQYSNTEKVSAVLEISRGNSLIGKFKFFNCLDIPNISFNGNMIVVVDKKKKEAVKNKNDKDKKNNNEKEKDKENKDDSIVLTPEEQNPPYKLLCYIDFTETDIDLKFRALNSNSLAILKDTIKQDNENKLKQQWEIDQPGRTKLSSTSRVKFMVEQKKENGEVLTLEDHRILNEQREIKTAANLNSNQNKRNVNKGVSDKKVKSDKDKEANILHTVTDFNFSKQPKMQHKNKDLVNYINYYNNRRLFAVEPSFIEPILKTTDILAKKKEDVIRNTDDYEKEYLKTDEEFESTKYLFSKNLEIEQKYMFGEREKLAKEKQLLQEKRKNLQSAMQLKFDSDIKLKRVLMYCNYKDFDLNDGLKVFSECCHTCVDNQLVRNVRMKLSEIKGEKILENLNKKIIKDKVTAEKAIEEINFYQLVIKNSILEKLGEFLKEDNKIPLLKIK